jgi:peptidyl-prolyl cis-trans isomerase SurA
MTVTALLLLGLLAGAPADHIVAVVGETPVLASELSQAADFYRMATLDSVTPDSALRREVLDQLIDNLLLQEQARIDTVDVTRDEIEAAVDENIAQLKTRFEGDDQFRAALAAEGMTERDLRRRYEDDARRKLLSQRLMEKEGLTRVYISPAESERFYQANRDSIALVPGRVSLAHLLVAINPTDAALEEGQRRATEVIDILSRGGDFGTVAGSFSDDRATAGRNGDWGWRELTDLPIDIALVLSQLEPGQVAPPFRTLEGFILLKLEQRQGDRVRFRSILLKVPLTRADTARARRRANSLRERILGGAPFDSVARQFSDDPVTADSGGRLGEFLIEGLTPPFDSVVRGLDSGEVSLPVLSEHGFHLVHAIAKQEEREMTYLEMQDMIRNYLVQQKQAERVQKYIQRISEDVYIKRYY